MVTTLETADIDGTIVYVGLSPLGEWICLSPLSLLAKSLLVPFGLFSLFL